METVGALILDLQLIYKKENHLHGVQWALKFISINSDVLNTKIHIKISISWHQIWLKEIVFLEIIK